MSNCQLEVVKIYHISGEMLGYYSKKYNLKNK